MSKPRIKRRKSRTEVRCFPPESPERAEGGWMGGWESCAGKRAKINDAAKFKDQYGADYKCCFKPCLSVW
jgi:hypothetical protein